MLPSHPDAQTLIAEVQGEYRRRYGSGDDAPVQDAEFTAPHGAFFVGYLSAAAGGDPVPVVTGAWRAMPQLVGDPALAEESGVAPAEIKRMYVRPSGQRRGLARRMLAHVEADLAAAGFDLAVLGTGMAQPEAMALYESSGYHAIAGFGFYAGYRDARHYAKPLDR